MPPTHIPQEGAMPPTQTVGGGHAPDPNCDAPAQNPWEGAMPPTGRIP